MLNSAERNTLLNLTASELSELRSKVRYKVCYQVGFASPDVEDIVQEAFKRFFEADEAGKIRSPDSVGAFLNGVSRNVIMEFRRRNHREEPMPEVEPDQPLRALPDFLLLEMRDSIEEGMRHLSPRDRQILHAFYLKENSVEEILETTGLTLANFRVVLCRAKDRFREIYQRR
jgi:RNA polymerase sigma factor (sigma-70 family)